MLHSHQSRLLHTHAYTQSHSLTSTAAMSIRTTSTVSMASMASTAALNNNRLNAVLSAGQRAKTTGVNSNAFAPEKEPHIIVGVFRDKAPNYYDWAQDRNIVFDMTSKNNKGEWTLSSRDKENLRSQVYRAMTEYSKKENGEFKYMKLRVKTQPYGLPEDKLVAYEDTGRAIIEDEVLFELINEHYSDVLLRFVVTDKE